MIPKDIQAEIISVEVISIIVAVAGLAQNFGAINSLITTGIQKGHMKMHLMNILNQIGATDTEKETLILHFKTNGVSHRAVAEALNKLRD